MNLSIIILAAGQGTRMRSNTPKVLHTLAGNPLLSHVYQTALSLAPNKINIVYGHGGEKVLELCRHFNANWFKQEQQLGTGHAVKQALDNLADESSILILFGDVPLISKTTLNKLVDASSESGFSLLVTEIEMPQGYGRIIRDDANNVSAIVEEKDTNCQQKKIKEINTGFMVVKGGLLKRWINLLSNKNAQQEYYLTDIVALAVKDNIHVVAVEADSVAEVQGVNTRVQLAEVERHYQLKQAQHFMNNGVRIVDPNRFDLRGELDVGVDSEIDINIVIEGKVKLGDNVSIGANCYLKDTVIGDNVTVLSNTMIDNATIGRACRIGPFARIRPETELTEAVHIGNFVELKKTKIAKGTKINHLSYLGDAVIGHETNIGAGTISCNYDGVNKHQTVIGDNVFVGSDVQLIAPVTVNNGATIAAGSTISKDVAEDELAIVRAVRKSIAKWKRPKKK